MRFGAATLTLTLALGLGVVGMASAQESGNWFTRLLSPAEKVDPDKLADKADAPKIPPAVNRTALKAAKKAKADWERRVDVCDKLRRIAEETAKAEGKPEQALPKIVEGRLNGFFKDAVLLEQPSVSDNKKTVKALLDEAGVTVTRFARFEVGQV